MRRRDFLTRGTLAAGLAGSPQLLPPLLANEGDAPQSPGQTAAAPEEIRSADYLRRAREDKFLPKPPVSRDSGGPAAVPVSPMPLAERIRRKIVPRRGFCSIAPASDALLISGNGAMSIETACHPYSEQVTFRHESLFTPHKRPFESPNIAGILPQVRQLLLEGKYQQAAKLGFDGVQISFGRKIVDDKLPLDNPEIIARYLQAVARDGLLADIHLLLGRPTAD